MSVDHIRYDLLTQEALRSVLRRVLQDAAKSGLPGDHHFYISFNTGAPGVRLSKRLRTQYPEEMTIVLQHQFRGLAVNEQAFEVGLSFSGVSEHLVVPFDAIKRFFDPSVQFGLQFETVGTIEEAGAQEGAAASTEADKAPAKPLPEGKPTAPAPAATGEEPAAKPAQPAAEGDAPRKGEGGAEVVRLDRFRKK
ncbi:MAG TPA: ClpXP protease specificity-enhancing factor SspB [Xanthobacteraceae bacterium]|nr:ClpXP protease specificity-enhancing factor SspB [Xanthobacteraceae bacterium]